AHDPDLLDQIHDERQTEGDAKEAEAARIDREHTAQASPEAPESAASMVVFALGRRRHWPSPTGPPSKSQSRTFHVPATGGDGGRPLSAPQPTRPNAHPFCPALGLVDDPGGCSSF